MRNVATSSKDLMIFIYRLGPVHISYSLKETWVLNICGQETDRGEFTDTLKKLVKPFFRNMYINPNFTSNSGGQSSSEAHSWSSGPLS